MNIVQGIENYNSSSQSILTIGTFDGVHIGHQKIIGSLVQQAKEKKLQSSLLTFFPHPRMVLQKQSSLKLIDTLKEKEFLLKKLGIDNLIIHPFSEEFSQLTAIEFTRDLLVDKLKIASLFIGYDHRFGKNREASVDDVIIYGKTYGFDLTVIPAQDIESITVSSTKVRTAIEESDFEKVNQFLGRPFQLNGIVTQGEGLGRTIGFPTANLEIPESYKLIPPKGVYMVDVEHRNRSYKGMMNIGNRPTLNGSHQTIEVHLFDFDQKIYGDSLKVLIVKKIREELKFDSLEALKTQLAVDQEICKRTGA
ncbi:MAG: bifunctional riboflavin kinase/FAD synthetase [Flavobacteriaceae bacterium]